LQEKGPSAGNTKKVATVMPSEGEASSAITLSCPVARHYQEDAQLFRESMGEAKSDRGARSDMYKDKRKNAWTLSE